jgi:hypothetical protein
MVIQLEEMSASEYTSAVTYYDESTGGMLIEGIEGGGIQIGKKTTDERLAQFAEKIIEDAKAEGFLISQSGAMSYLKKLRTQAK